MISTFWNYVKKLEQSNLIRDIALVLVILCIAAGAWVLRTTGIEWDQNYHLHPDERFLTMVETSIQPSGNLSEYFNTGLSSLNPANRGYTFFVYGTLPIFIVRYLGQWFNQMGYDQVNVLGRLVSATFDVGTVLIIFLISLRLYKKTLLSLLAAAFYAVAVLPIQLSHFFVVETVTNFFGFLTFLMAVYIFTKPSSEAFVQNISGIREGNNRISNKFSAWFKLSRSHLLLYAFFGLSIGLAAASKINAVILFILLPIAMLPVLLVEREHWIDRFWRFLVPAGLIAGIVAFLTFRFFQPYAFNGPSFFNFALNPAWVANLKELSNLSSPSSNFPPNVQWANRPIWFSLQNMVTWGLGLPLGILAITSFIWMIWRTIKGEWKQHLLLVVWTAFYFTYQSLVYNRTMRYQMLVYPAFVIVAAWGVFSTYGKGQELKQKAKQALSVVIKTLAIVVGVVVLGLTTAWAIGFVHIYTQPITRIAASTWIYQNVPGPMNLEINTANEVLNEPITYPLGLDIHPSQPVSQVYIAPMDGNILSLTFSHIVDSNPLALDPTVVNPVKTFQVSVSDLDSTLVTPYQAQIQDAFTAVSDPRGDAHTVTFDPPIPLIKDHHYQLTYGVSGDIQYLSYYGPNTFDVVSEGVTYQLPVLEPVKLLNNGDSFSTVIIPISDGETGTLYIPHIVDWNNSTSMKKLTATLTIEDGDVTWFLGSATVTSTFQASDDPRGAGYTFEFDHPIKLLKNTQYTLTLQNSAGNGSLAVYGSRQVNESSWDDPLPYSLYGINVFDYFTGVYRTDLNFEMYWDDNPDKLTRLVSDLNQADYLFISSNRQWGSISRLPGQYPLSTEFYRDLIGCPADKEISLCFSIAEPGMFTGKLGYQLIKVFQSEPTLGSLSVNTQFAEEAFTVYDHPKVLIFEKTKGFNIQNVQTLLAAAGLPGSTSSTSTSIKNGLMLNTDQVQEQQAGGTWSDLFSRDAIINKYPGIGLIVWYLFISLLGWAVYPLVRIGLGGLNDRGYPFTKLIGMLLFAFIAWIAGSLSIPVTRNLLIWVFIGLVAINSLLFFFYRKSILVEIKTHWKHILFIELLGLIFFLFFLLVRLGDPDLWQTWKMGEKPMDFSYLNAVIKSTIFPPYDPWFAGGYINYYYFGFVIAGMPVKLLGIIPSIAFNLILPTFFSFVGMGAFSIGWNIVHRWLEDRVQKSKDDHPRKLTVAQVALIAGLIAAIFVLILGNLGTVRMIWQGFQYLGTNGQSIDNVSILQHWVWAFQGFIKFIGGRSLIYGDIEYYWIPSRAIPGDVITEFPYFTFLFADPHAHLFALPISILAIAWALAMVLRRWKWNRLGEGKGWLNFLITFFLGGLVIGALRPTNTWDIFTYLPLGIVAILYAGFKYLKPNPNSLRSIPDFWKRMFIVLGSTGLLVALAYLLYQPFSYWFAQGYNQVAIWKGDYTPFWSYVTHWGLFLFICLTWIIWEFRDWLATTPASSLRKLTPYRGLIWVGGVLSLAAIILMLYTGIEIAWLVVPMILFSLLLTLRSNYSEMRRVISFLFTLGLTLTLVVELVYLKGDVGRMNTVFKIYMQAWTIMAISSAGSLVLLWASIKEVWKESFRRFWLTGLIILIVSAGLYIVVGTVHRIYNRDSTDVPLTLDGMASIPYSSYPDVGYTNEMVTYPLEQDYRAILWMQDNIEGSPVIVEGHETEYRWGNRYTIYTGLPGVVGWNNHQRQQRGVVSGDAVSERVNEVGEFYTTTDQAFVTKFLKEYNVKYIIVGLLEKTIYPPEGLQKFIDWNGTLWHRVYLDRDTAIYQVGS